MSKLSCTQVIRGRPVTREEATASIQRLINSHFHNPNSARCSIPVRADDDDVVASDYVKECAERIARLEQECEELKSMLQVRSIEVSNEELLTNAHILDNERLRKETSELKAQVARLSAPVSQREIIMRAGNSEPISPGGAAILYNAIIAARAKGDHAKEEP